MDLSAAVTGAQSFNGKRAAVVFLVGFIILVIAYNKSKKKEK